MPKPSAQEHEQFLLRASPTHDGLPWTLVEHVDGHFIRLRLPARSAELRPGATIAGPVLMGLADVTAWGLLLHNLGFGAVQSVTSQLNMNFLSRPLPGDVVAHGELLKLGKRLAVAEVRLFSDGKSQPVALATVTYAVHRDA